MSGKSAVLAKHDNDVVVVAAYRTAITKVSYLTQENPPNLTAFSLGDNAGLVGS